MRKFRKILVVLLLCVLQSGFAADRAGSILTQLAAEFRVMKGYEVAFAVTTSDYTASGSYAVEGEKYYLRFGDAEVFCDGKVRCEVDNRRHEVTINEVDLTSHNILNNPAHAFDFLGDEYAASLLWERDGKAAILLTPTVKNATAGSTITLTLTTATLRPVSLVYTYDGEQIHISIREITPLTSPLKQFDNTAFSGYEQIDFR